MQVKAVSQCPRRALDHPLVNHLSTEVAVTEHGSTGELNRARFERLARSIGEELRTQTYSQAPVGEINIEKWRQAARLAGRRLGLVCAQRSATATSTLGPSTCRCPNGCGSGLSRAWRASARSLLTPPAKKDG